MIINYHYQDLLRPLWSFLSRVISSVGVFLIAHLEYLACLFLLLVFVTPDVSPGLLCINFWFLSSWFLCYLLDLCFILFPLEPFFLLVSFVISLLLAVCCLFFLFLLGDPGKLLSSLIPLFPFVLICYGQLSFFSRLFLNLFLMSYFRIFPDFWEEGNFVQVVGLVILFLFLFYCVFPPSSWICFWLRFLFTSWLCYWFCSLFAWSSLWIFWF